MSQSHTGKRPVVKCKRCRQRRKTVLLGEMICEVCHRKEPKATCGVCGKEKRFVKDGLCPLCVRRAILLTKIECARCGRSKPVAKPYGAYCQDCQRIVNCGEGRCSRCGKDKPYVHRKDKICRRCNLNRHAPKRLQRYLETVRITNEYNLTLFRHLAGLINWATVNERTWNRFHEFAVFLQSHQFDGPLTWGSIRELRATLLGKRYAHVRSCLEQLGELLLEPAIDEDVEECEPESKPLVPISSLEADVIAVSKKYDLWVRTERRNTPRASLNHFRTLLRFGRWCATRGLTSLATVEAAHVEEYLHTLGLKWKCRHCSFTKNVTARGEAPPAACEHSECGALHSYEKVIRCVERSVYEYRARLRIFFGWLKDVEEGIEVNPAPPAQRRKRRKQRGRRTRKYPVTIQYYDWEVIDALWKAIEDPDMPAEEAMLLYLLLNHAFYVWELRTVRIPSQCRPIALGVESRESLADVLSLEWQPREFSRGRQSLGRTGAILRLEPADEPWLGDLVGRFMRERNQKLRDPNNPYLFVGTSKSLRGGPVSDAYFRHMIESATARITGRVCTVNILGKCSRLLYAEFGGHEGFRHLRELGLTEQHARSYAWAKPVRVVPKQANRIRTKDAKQRRLSLTVPPIDVFGMPTDFGRE